MRAKAHRVTGLQRWSWPLLPPSLGVIGIYVLLTSATSPLEAQTTMHLPEGSERLDSVGLLLTEQIRDRMDAIARGDSATWSRSVDPDFSLITGNADMDTRASNAAWMATRHRETPGVQRTCDVGDIQVHRHGDIAVLTDVVRNHARYGDQIVSDASRYTNTYYRRAGRWILIASQQTYFPAEPGFSGSKIGDVDAYVGVYEWGGGFTDTITSDGSRLYSRQSDDAEEYELLSQGSDRFIPKGYGVESLTFTRDSEGKVTGYISRMAGGAVAVARKLK